MANPAQPISHQALVEGSWSRCERYGLHPLSIPSFGDPAERDVNALLERQRSLVQTTQREVLPYYENILSNSSCLILLADSGGQLLESWGDRRFVEPAQQRGFKPGASWMERDTGTNAIGTALASGQAVHIQRDEHFLQANRYLSGAASPIYDAQRQLIAVLDVSSDSYLPPSHTLGMVKMMSQSVENRLILNLFRDDYFQLTFNTGQDNLDSQWAALLVFDESGLIVSANRRADNLLGVALTRSRIDRLFDVPLRQLLSQPEDQPLLLRTAGNHRFHGLVRRPQKPRIQARDFRTPDGRPEHTIDLASIDQGDPQVHKVIRQAQLMLEKDIPILVNGETGVGKEVLVKALHAASSRANAPLIAVNCAAIPSELIESELFGYEKGAFTGAHQKGSLGLIRKADGGVLFLDEIGDMPLSLQARLLRVLQERSVQPLGGGEPYSVDFRLICATNRSLRQEVEKGCFRQDLFYRVSGLGVELPPLRARHDKHALFQRVWEQHREPHQWAGLSPDVLRLFDSHPWPGNIRQLSSVVQVALALAQDQPIRVEHLPDDFLTDTDVRLTAQGGTGASASTSETVPFPMLANEPLRTQFEACRGNVSHLARHLGVSRNTLYKRLRAEGLYPT
ncbi:sigma-54-dependent Fis family transcriptional regulator [Stutzerimonas zhaodongensis]|jgi:transcriptional regulator of acetoin/glycerol metabolism|uniref:sigma-54-dependent Fis family transcriptional regulator n=1 Tax=Stutzerimonas zhaodongensis TaxID=1176257 RepID=UPI001F4D85CA|nr:sigma-54-dependent Fis family transcriptional regulator [Stutzerimonas zhaodongensis]UNG20760.1 sigma-54-dependent Fis family transcriptional regulator [Stutzerimonas zhaodongensis]